MDPACSGEHSRDEQLLDTTAGICLTILLVLGFVCILQQRLALGPKLSIEGYLDTVATTAHFTHDGDVNNEIGVPCKVEVLNLDITTLTPPCCSNVSSLGRNPAAQARLTTVATTVVVESVYQGENLIKRVNGN